MTWSSGEDELTSLRVNLVVASRAAGIEPPIDTVWVRLQDEAGLRASVERSRHLGFQGRMCIHPDQVTLVNAAFTPSEEEAARAQKIVDAFRQAESSGLAAIQVDGAFVDYPVFHRAERVLATLAAIRARGG
jgi:citrate lyase subunit beta/citryl-CoA lyase